MPVPYRGRDEVAEHELRDFQCPARAFDVPHAAHSSSRAVARKRLLRAARLFELATKRQPRQRRTAERDRSVHLSAERASPTDLLAGPQVGGWPCPDCRLLP